MYPVILQSHSVLRYLVLLMLIAVVIRFIFGKIFKRQYNNLDDKLSLITLMFVHLQFLLGLVLFFISPITATAMEDMAAAMKETELRFWAVEHTTLMILAVILITVGRIRSKSNGLRSDEKFRRLIIFYSIGFVLIVAGIPWERMF
jgi:hypothetical protein